MTLSADSQLAQEQRIVSVDLLRGLVMVLMTLDHTRDFFSNAHFDLTDLDRTTPALFLTRWITHFCAPVFILLAGSSAFFAMQRHPLIHVRSFLIKRGLFLIFLGLSLESFIWTPRPDFSLLSGAVLWAIGWSMLTLACLAGLPTAVVTCIGLVVICGHNALDSIRAADMHALAPLWSILHTGEHIQLTPTLAFEPFYPLVPWVGVIAVGYGLGQILLLPPTQSRKWLTGTGLLLVILFVVLRAMNGYGDPRPWTLQNNTLATLLSFVKCQKYPPSLLYLLMTLGPALMLLSCIDRLPSILTARLLVFGRTALFFYILHLPFILSLAILVATVRTGTIPAILEQPFQAAGYGYSLPVVYGLWVVVLLSLYPLCRWYADFKTRHVHWHWLSYI